MQACTRARNNRRALVWAVPVWLLSACGGGGGGGGSPSPYEPTVYEATYSGGSYQYSSQYYITLAPDDTDWSRWGIMHDGADYRLYFMKAGTSDTLYQFAYNPNSADYEWGYNSVRQLRLTNIPADADTSSIAMSHVGNTAITSYYAHMKSLSTDTRLYTFRFDGSNYVYERSYNITNAPADTDWSRWAMVYADDASRFYAGKIGDDSTIYQFKYNPATESYQWGYGKAIGTIAVTGMPADSDTYDFGMLNNGTLYRFFYRNRQ